MINKQVYICPTLGKAMDPSHTQIWQLKYKIDVFESILTLLTEKAVELFKERQELLRCPLNDLLKKKLYMIERKMSCIFNQQAVIQHEMDIYLAIINDVGAGYEST